jgi:hypothetical protein
VPVEHFISLFVCVCLKSELLRLEGVGNNGYYSRKTLFQESEENNSVILGSVMTWQLTRWFSGQAGLGLKFLESLASDQLRE